MLELKKLSQDAVDRLKVQWKSQLDKINSDAEANFLYSDLNRTLALCEKHINEKKDCLYTLESGDGKVKAVAEILNASAGKDPSFKFLTVDLEPDLSTEWQDRLDSFIINKITEVLVAVIIRAIELTSDGGQNKLKIFNRTEEMNGIFDVLLSQSDQLPGLKLYRQSKWLIIEMEKNS